MTKPPYLSPDTDFCGWVEEPDTARDGLVADLAAIGPLPICEEWTYSAIRHCQRNMELDVEDGFFEPSRQCGGSIARLVNATPVLLARIETLEAQHAEDAKRIAWMERDVEQGRAAFDEQAKRIADLEALLRPLAERATLLEEAREAWSPSKGPLDDEYAVAVKLGALRVIRAALNGAHLMTDNITSSDAEIGELLEEIRFDADLLTAIGRITTSTLLRRAAHAISSLETKAAEDAKRIDDLDGAMMYLESEARRFAKFYPQVSDGRNTFDIFADKISALKERP